MSLLSPQGAPRLGNALSPGSTQVRKCFLKVSPEDALYRISKGASEKWKEEGCSSLAWEPLLMQNAGGLHGSPPLWLMGRPPGETGLTTAQSAVTFQCGHGFTRSWGVQSVDVGTNSPGLSCWLAVSLVRPSSLCEPLFYHWRSGSTWMVFSYVRRKWLCTASFIGSAGKVVAIVIIHHEGKCSHTKIFFLLCHQSDPRGTTWAFLGPRTSEAWTKTLPLEMAINPQQLRAEFRDTWLGRTRSYSLSFPPSLFYLLPSPFSLHSYSLEMMHHPPGHCSGRNLLPVLSDPEMADGCSLQPLTAFKMSSSVLPGPQQNAFGKSRRKG